MRVRIRREFVYWFSIAALALTVSFLLGSSHRFEEDGEDRLYKEAFEQNYNIYALRLPEEMNFAGEKVPLEIFHVKERLDRELLVNVYWQSNMILLIKRANRWFPIIEPILKENKIPDDFKFLALIESGLLNVNSSAGASGFWQMLSPTAKHYGLEVNEYVDERFHLEKSTRAACQFLKDAYARFGNWTLVAASYNTGETNIRYHIKTQGLENYYRMHLPDETLRYIFRILAVKAIYNHQKEYGFHLREKDLYPVLAVKQLTIDTTVNDLFRLAQELHVSYQELKMYNPWLRARSLPNKSRKIYSIDLPKQNGDSIDFSR